MSHLCEYCDGPITGTGATGRPWPGRPAAAYCCYGCLSLGEQDRESELTAEKPSSSGFPLDGRAVRLGVGLLVAGQSMLFGLAVSLTPPDGPTRFLVQGTILLSTLLVMVLLGGPLVRAAWAETARGRVTIEALFVLTLFGAFAASIQSFLTGVGPIYFEVVSVLLVVYSLGKMIGARSRATAMASTRLWAKSLATCRLIGERGRTRDMEVSQVVPGDVVEVRPGETIPVDGVVRAGVGFVSEAAVSGEPFAVVRRPGDAVLAGAASNDATFRIAVTSEGKTRQIDRLLQAVEEARERPISLQARADRIGRVFLPLIVGVAVSTFAAWSHLDGWQVGLFHAMSVLLVACPCALGLATPVLIWTALTRLAERGVIAHAGDAVERMAEVDTVVFDKTGTLTEERFVLLDVATLATGEERARLLGWLSLVEEHSSHPIARPFATLPRAAGATIRSLRVEPGCGVSAELQDGDRVRPIRVGRAEWIGADAARERAILDQLLTTDGHRIDFEVDGRLEAVAVVSERLRETANDTLIQLHQMGLRVAVMTGDTSERAARLELRDVEAGLRPDDKTERVRELAAGGARVLMVGDGINDAGAMAAAHAAIALSCGTELAIGASSATLYHDDLRVVPWALALARRAVDQVRRNLLLAAGYNVVGITLAALGLLHPIAAAVLMVMSSLVVVWSSTRLGVTPDDCGCDFQASGGRKPPESEFAPRIDDRGEDSGGLRPPLAWKSLTHALALCGQGVLACLLLGIVGVPAMATIFAFTLAGLIVARTWGRWEHIPHGVDMCVGMLTLGNLGMLLGWWADLGFGPPSELGCACCVEAMSRGTYHFGMWFGMLAFANVAMIALRRRPYPEHCGHLPAMFTGGNVGMMVGMWAGGFLAGRIGFASWPAEAGASFAGMTLGMLAGMWLGTEVVRPLFRPRLSADPKAA